MPPKKKETVCLQCKEKVTEKQYSVQCSICDRWIHKDCGLDDDEFKLIEKISSKTGSHFWSCEGCSLGLSKLHKMVAENGREIATLKNDVTDLQTENTKQNTDIQSNKDNIALVKADVEKMKENSSAVQSQTVFDELEQREAKKLNLVIFSLDEQDSELRPLERKQLDTETVTKIFQDLGCQIDAENDIKFISRVGEYVSNKSRPLTVGFKAEDKKDKILKSAWKLAKSRYKHISISPDLTKMQVEKEKELIGKAKDLNSKLTPEEAKNFHWKLVGKKGQRQIKKIWKKTEENNLNQNRQRIGSVRRSREEMEANDLQDNNLAEESRIPSKRRC